MAVTRVYVCTGRHCRGADGFREAVALCADADRGRTVPCQGICDGPVVGVRRGERPVRWYARVRGMRRRRLRAALRGTQRWSAVKAFEVRRRRGRQRR